MLSLGWQEMVVIFLAALVLFGPKKLPELGRTIGKAVTEFRRASNELKATFDREMQSIERENESLRETTQKYMDDISGSMSDDHHSSHSNSSSTYQPGTYEDSGYYDSAYYDSEHYRSLEDGGGAAHSESNPNTDSTTTADNSHVGEPATQGAESTTAASVTLKPAEGTVSRSSAIESPAAAEKA
ncbi:MAG: twin-arginine translocase TatA/TatE family subunit [Acidobacteria bacterium]|nr:twin-arginine translocase TatA/TatE family subunit [Acidobacteriota bacterium]